MNHFCLYPMAAPDEKKEPTFMAWPVHDSFCDTLEKVLVHWSNPANYRDTDRVPIDDFAQMTEEEQDEVRRTKHILHPPSETLKTNARTVAHNIDTRFPSITRMRHPMSVYYDWTLHAVIMCSCMAWDNVSITLSVFSDPIAPTCTFHTYQQGPGGGLVPQKAEELLYNEAFERLREMKM